MLNVGYSQVNFKSWWDKPATEVGKEALKRAKNAETSSILKKYMKANDYGNIYYELDNGKKYFSREEAVEEIRKNLIDYVR